MLGSMSKSNAGGWLSLLLLVVATLAVETYLFASRQHRLSSKPCILNISPSNHFSFSAHIGESVDATFMISNPGKEAVQVLGARTTCGCVMPNGFPITVPAGASIPATFKIHVGKPAEDGHVRQSASIFVNKEGIIPRIDFDISTKN